MRRTSATFPNKEPLIACKKAASRLVSVSVRGALNFTSISIIKLPVLGLKKMMKDMIKQYLMLKNALENNPNSIIMPKIRNPFCLHLPMMKPVLNNQRIVLITSSPQYHCWFTIESVRLFVCVIFNKICRLIVPILRISLRSAVTVDISACATEQKLRKMTSSTNLS